MLLYIQTHFYVKVWNHVFKQTLQEITQLAKNNPTKQN